ncbi:hypothetical protein BT93_F3134 [Corymbia citriodora subsp. variegata]|nr:hypothetical protein BT93_F3134 [Corymbia citriodora subsp. variegata]
MAIFMVIVFLGFGNCIHAANDLTLKFATSLKNLHPMMACPDGGPVPSTNGTSIRIGSDRFCYLSFAADCSFDSSGLPVNCGTGGCGKNTCTLDNPPVVATTIVFNRGTVRITIAKGYNFGLRAEFLCAGCPSFSCVIPLNTCPDNLKELDNSGSLVGCNSGVGLPSGENCPADGPSSDGKNVFTWPIPNPILMIHVVP